MKDTKQFLVTFIKCRDMDYIPPSAMQSIDGGKTLFVLNLSSTLDKRPIDLPTFRSFWIPVAVCEPGANNTDLSVNNTDVTQKETGKIPNKTEIIANNPDKSDKAITDLENYIAEAFAFKEIDTYDPTAQFKGLNKISNPDVFIPKLVFTKKEEVKPVVLDKNSKLSFD